MIEPKRQSDLKLLNKDTYSKAVVFQGVAKKYGLEIKSFETLRTKERQSYLYSIGRTIQKNKKPVTRTLDSLHLKGKAIDWVFIKNKQPSRQGNRSLFWKIAERCGFESIPQEQCHTQDNQQSISSVIYGNSQGWGLTKDIQLKNIMEDINKSFRVLGYK